MSQSDKPTSVSHWREVFGLLGVVLVAYIGYLGTRSQILIPIQATQTAEAKFTELALSLTIPPTNTSTANLMPLIMKPPLQIMIEAEDGMGEGEIKSRSNASNETTVWLHDSDNTRSIRFEITEPNSYNLRIRYSSDRDFAQETLRIYLDNVFIDSFLIGDTGDNGLGWDNFSFSGVIHLGELDSGTHIIGVFPSKLPSTPGVEHTYAGIEIDTLILVSSPYILLLENFENKRQMIWWVPEVDADVFWYSESDKAAHSGNNSFSVKYHKTSQYQFIGASPPPALSDFSLASKLEIWVYGQANILLKLQDKDLNEQELGTQSSSEENAWHRLQFDLSKVSDNIDLKNIKNIFFFIVPNDPSAIGNIFLDDLALLSE